MIRREVQHLDRGVVGLLRVDRCAIERCGAHRSGRIRTDDGVRVRARPHPARAASGDRGGGRRSPRSRPRARASVAAAAARASVRTMAGACTRSVTPCTWTRNRVPASSSSSRCRSTTGRSLGQLQRPAGPIKRVVGIPAGQIGHQALIGRDPDLATDAALLAPQDAAVNPERQPQLPADLGRAPHVAIGERAAPLVPGKARWAWACRRRLPCAASFPSGSRPPVRAQVASLREDALGVTAGTG